MVPVHFMELPEFPLTSNGKIDRKALPQPQQQTHTYRAPATETEQLLAGIWESVLNRDQIGLDDNFFDIGGNSLKAMQVISRIFREHSIKLGIRDLFSNPVLSQFVEKVEIMMWINDPITSDLSSNTDEIIL
jgi:aryl carrier-like protein